MSVAAAYLYRDGERVRPVSLDEPEDCDTARSEFIWIELFEPSEGELNSLEAGYGLHPLAMEDALHGRQLPKVDIYDEHLFVLARTAHLESGRIVYGAVAIFLAKSHVITVRKGAAHTHAGLRARLEAAPALLSHGVDYVLHAILDCIVDGYLPVVEEIEEEVLDMERRALDAFLERHEVARIFTLRRELIRFQRLLGPTSQACRDLVELVELEIDPGARLYFRDVLAHVRRVDTMVTSLRETLSSVFEASNLLEQQRQGRITRQLAAWAAILAVPTAIAGIYGMNFQNMPELKMQYGYFVVLSVILTTCSALFLWFKRTQWL